MLLLVLSRKILPAQRKGAYCAPIPKSEVPEKLREVFGARTGACCHVLLLMHPSAYSKNSADVISDF